MEQIEESLTTRVERVYRSAGADPELSSILPLVNASSDDEIAELVEVDGRTRIGLRREVKLERYLASIPDLAERELVLDAALDVVLRSMSGGARPTRRAVEELTTAFPDLAAAISDAALLGRAVVSTTGVSQLVRSTPKREVPAEFGPAGENGIARYQLIKVLGSGSSGEVYLAIDRLLSEPDRAAKVAIKVIGSQRRSTRARLQLAEEASKARRVLHDNVVRVLDRGVSEEGDDYIVYDHIEGGDLDQWLEKNGPRVDPRIAAQMVSKLARGLQAAHVAGLVHCDLKPANVLVTEGGEPKVADFGIALRESDLAANAGREVRPMGNVAFMSPEQYRGEAGSLGPISDVYALGGILYYMLTGRLPNGASVEEVARTHDAKLGREVAPNPRDDRPELEDDLAAICRRAMAISPGERHASAAALADDLGAWLRHEPIGWRRPSVWRVARLAARRRPALAATTAVAVVSILAGAGGVGYWVSVASRNRQRAESLDHSMGLARDQVSSVLGFLYSLRDAGYGQNLIPLAVALEGVAGPTVLGKGEQREALWKLKCDTAEQVISTFEQAGRGSDAETLLWHAVLGLWLVDEGRFDEASSVLRSALSKWESKGQMADGTANQTWRLSRAVRVFQLDEQAKGGPLDEAARSELLTLQQDVSKAVDSAGIGGGIPTRERLLEARVALFGPRLLNDPQALRVAEDRLKRFREANTKLWSERVAENLEKGAAPKK